MLPQVEAVTDNCGILETWNWKVLPPFNIFHKSRQHLFFLPHFYSIIKKETLIWDSKLAFGESHHMLAT